MLFFYKKFNFNNSLFRFLLYDCDPFTRSYFKDILQINQPDPIEVLKPKDNSYCPTVYKNVIIFY